MAARKQFQSSLAVPPELSRLLEEARNTQVSEEELREQRVSFAYGNAPQSDLITKDSVRRSGTLSLSPRMTLRWKEGKT